MVQYTFAAKALLYYAIVTTIGNTNGGGEFSVNAFANVRPFSTSFIRNHRNTHTKHDIKNLHNPRLTMKMSESSSDNDSILLFNSKTRSKDVFTPQNPNGKEVTMYTCGPTVYDFAHVGNFRAFLTYDLLKRVLTYLGYNIKHVCNITDVDDKIINKCNELDIKNAYTLTSKYEELFMNDLKALNIVPADIYPRATEHISDMVDMITILSDKGLAYQTKSGSWYFDVMKHDGYGKQLVDLSWDDMISTDRSEDDEKVNQHDFCLWKAYKPGIDREDDMIWDDPVIGKGRPGWHLECSAMIRKYFGDETIDIHCGGVDLKFPHHENEIAQSEATTGQTMCNCWVHNGFVNIDNEKMSKSLNNFLTLRSACPKPIDVRAYRYLVITSHYRNPLNFSKQVIDASKSALKRIDKVRDDIIKTLKDFKDNDENVSSASEIASKLIPKEMENFNIAIKDDLSMPRATASMFNCIKIAEGEFKRYNSLNNEDEKENNPLDIEGLRSILNTINEMDKIFGIFYDVPMSEEEQQEEQENDKVPDEVLELSKKRTEAKNSKDWELADSLRAKITEYGFNVKDVKGGEPIISRIE